MSKPTDEPRIELLPPQPPEPDHIEVHPWGIVRFERMTREEFENKNPSPKKYVDVGGPMDGVVEFYHADGRTTKRPIIAGRIVDGE